MNKKPLLLLTVIFLSLLAETIASVLDGPRLRVVVGVLKELKIKPKVFFKPGDIVYVYWSYRPYIVKRGLIYEYDFAAEIVIYDPLGYELYRYSSRNSSKTKYSSIVLKEYLVFTIREYYLNGIYRVRVLVQDFKENASRVEEAFFIVANATPKILKVNIVQEAKVKNMLSETSTLTYLYLAVIPDTIYQKVIEEPVFNIKPAEILEDGFGNKYAVYKYVKIPPHGYLHIIAEYPVVLYAKRVDLNKSIGSLSAVPSSVEKYLYPSEKIESDNLLIKSKALQLSSNKSSLLELLTSIGDFVSTHIKYKPMEKETSALKALLSGEGDCTEYSLLFTALCRASGIPARSVSGCARIAPHRGEVIIYERHAWVEAYIPGEGWVPIEPQQPKYIGLTYYYANGYYLTISRCPGEETWIRGVKARVGFLIAYYKKGAFSLEHYIRVIFTKKDKIRIEVSEIRQLDGEIWVKGSLSEPVKGEIYVLTLTSSGRSLLTSMSVENGVFEGKVPISERGRVKLYIFFDELEDYEASVYSTSIFIEKKKSSIKAEYPTNVYEGDKVVIKGYLSPPLPNQIILVKIAGPGEIIVDYSTCTKENGEFILELSFPRAGTWTVQLSWLGTSDYSPAELKLTIQVREAYQKYMILIILTAVIAVIIVLLLAIIVKTRHRY